MNITPLTIYLWQLADNLIGAASVLSVLAGILSAILIYLWKFECEEACKKYFFTSAAAFLIFLATTVFTPSSHTIAMMVVIPKITNSEVVKRDIPDLYDAAIKALKETLTK